MDRRAVLGTPVCHPRPGFSRALERGLFSCPLGRIDPALAAGNRPAGSQNSVLEPRGRAFAVCDTPGRNSRRAHESAPAESARFAAVSSVFRDTPPNDGIPGSREAPTGYLLNL